MRGTGNESISEDKNKKEKKPNIIDTTSYIHARNSDNKVVSIEKNNKTKTNLIKENHPAQKRSKHNSKQIVLTLYKSKTNEDFLKIDSYSLICRIVYLFTKSLAYIKIAFVTVESLEI